MIWMKLTILYQVTSALFKQVIHGWMPSVAEISNSTCRIHWYCAADVNFGTENNKRNL